MSTAKYELVIGQVFNRLTVLEEIREAKYGQRRWICICECGNQVTTTPFRLHKRHAKSCGCYSSDQTAQRNTTHNKSKLPGYAIWKNIRTRCYNTKTKVYKNYGGRGIELCERWQDFSKFLDDLGSRPTPKHSVERKDNNGNYCPENCCWATRKEQGRNQRSNRPLEFKGETHIMIEWAEKLNIPAYVIHDRLKLGWTVERALSDPYKRKPRKLTAQKKVE